MSGAHPYDEFPVGVIVAGSDGGIVSVNARLARMLRTTPENITGKPWFDLVEPASRARAEADWKQAVATGLDAAMDLRFARSDGVLHARVDLAPSAKAGEWLATVVDITAERDALYRLFMQAPASIAIVRGPDFVYELSNEMNQRLLGGRDVIGKSVREAFPELARQGLYETLERVYQTGEPFVADAAPVNVLGPDGTLRDAFLAGTYTPLRDGQGRIEGVMAFAYEVTDLVEARRALESASVTKDEFLAAVSHELRTPLSSILGWASLLKGNTHDAPAVEKALEVIERNARSQMRLIEDILDFSRVVRGEMRLSPKTVDVAQLAREVQESVVPSAEAKDITLVSHGLDVPCKLVADPDRLRQVMWNLLANAVKFTPPAGRVEIGVQRAVENNAGLVEIVVRDSGRGMDAAFVPQAFEPFRQGDSRSTGAGGVGLGLAIVKKIVEAHGGNVTAESAGEGKGSSFRVTLPIASIARRPDETGRNPPFRDRESARSRRLEAIRILVVEDDPDGRELVEITLAREGANVRTAATAQAALSEIESASFDVVLSDIGLPERDGYWLAREIRRERPTQTLVALTAFGRPEDVTRALDAGFAAHLTKPVEPTDLVETITRSIARA